MISDFEGEIRIETYMEDILEILCPICNLKIDRKNIIEHLENHSDAIATKKRSERLVAPCGCKFDSMMAAKRHVEINRGLCGYYYYKRNEENEHLLIKINHVIRSRDETYWEGYVFELADKRVHCGLVRDGQWTQYIYPAAPGSEIPLRVMMGLIKISEEEFRKKIRELSLMIEDRVLQSSCAKREEGT